MRKKILVIVVFLLFLVPLFSGCEPFTIESPTRVMVNGGGWIEASELVPPDREETENIEKATFGFRFDMYDIVWESEALVEYKVKGHLTYIDHVTGEKIIGPITDIVMTGAEGIIGTYGDGGTFRFMPIAGENPNDPDYFEIYITGGPYSGYMNEGMLKGGNITVVSYY